MSPIGSVGRSIRGRRLPDAIPDSGLVHNHDAQTLSAAQGETVASISDTVASNDLSNGSGTYESSGIGGNPAVDIDNTEFDAAAIPTGSNQVYTVAVVFKFKAAATEYAIFANGDGDGYTINDDSGQYNWTYPGVANNRFGTVDTNSHIMIGAYDGSTLYVDLDGTNQINNTISLTEPSTAAYLGQRPAFTTNSPLLFGELRWYDIFYDSSGRTEIHDGLANKWGLA